MQIPSVLLRRRLPFSRGIIPTSVKKRDNCSYSFRTRKWFVTVTFQNSHDYATSLWSEERQIAGSRHWELIISTVMRTCAREGDRDFQWRDVVTKDLWRQLTEKKTEYCLVISCYPRTIWCHFNWVGIVGLCIIFSKLGKVPIPRKKIHIIFRLYGRMEWFQEEKGKIKSVRQFLLASTNPCDDFAVLQKVHNITREKMTKMQYLSHDYQYAQVQKFPILSLQDCWHVYIKDWNIFFDSKKFCIRKDILKENRMSNESCTFVV